MPNLMSDQEFAQRFRAAMEVVAQRETHQFVFEMANTPVAQPRASAIGTCALQQLWRIQGKKPSMPPNPTSLWPQLLGLAGQSIVEEILRVMGYEVINGKREYHFGPMVCHPDGLLRGLDLGDSTALWDCKVRNLYGLSELLRKGLPDAEPAMEAQMQVGMAATSTELTIITALPFDLSAARLEVFRKRGIETAEPLVNRVIVQASKERQDLMLARGEALSVAALTGMTVAREFNPADGKFPCTFCPFMEDCLLNTAEPDMVIPAL